VTRVRLGHANGGGGRHRAQLTSQRPSPAESASRSPWGAGGRAVLALVSALVLLGSGYLSVTTHRLIARLHRVEAIPPGGALGVPKDDLDAGAQNILVAAARTARPIEALAILHLPRANKHPVLLWLAPDTWTDIPGYGTGRLANATDVGGRYQPLVQAVDELTGLTINRFLRLDVSRLARATDVAPVLAACRENRNGASGAAQLIRPLLKRLTDTRLMLDPFRLERTVSAVGDAVQIDTGANPLKLAQQLAAVGDPQLTITTIPVLDPVPGHSDRLAVNVDAVRTFIARMVIDPVGFARAVDGTNSLDSRHAVVLDGSGDSHASAQVADTLRSAGIAIDTIGQTSSAAATLIKYPPGQEGLARTIATLVPGGRLIPTSSVMKVTVILGSDRVRSGAAVATASCLE
jgi:LytR cell envelope-related transcriptional attenuator